MHTSRYFDLLKAFVNIKRVVKSDFLFETDLFYIKRALHVQSYHDTTIQYGGNKNKNTIGGIGIYKGGGGGGDITL